MPTQATTNTTTKPPVGTPVFDPPQITDPAVDEKAKKKAADEEKEKQRLALNDAKALGLGAHLMTLSLDMGGENSKAFIQKLDEIDDPDLRTKTLKQFEKMTGQTMKSFIESCNDWNNNGDKRDKHAALQLIDDKRGHAEDTIRKMDPTLRAIKEKEANDRAIQILSATTAHDSSDENMQKIFRALGPCDAVEIEMIRAAVRKHTDGQSNLYQAIDNGTKKGDEDEAIAMLAGDRVGSARAALNNETDPKRLREVITALKPKELEELRLGGFHELYLAEIKNPADRAEMRALIEGDRAKADGEHLANLLRPRKQGYEMGDKVRKDNYDRRKASNVMKEFEGMSGEDVKAAADTWNKTHPPWESFECLIRARWGDDDDPAEMNRLLAMTKGDKGLARSIRLEAGMRDKDQEEIEAALAHQKLDAKELTSNDPEVRKKAEATKRENESFEKNNRESDRVTRQAQMILRGNVLEAQKAVGVDTKQQLVEHYDARAKEDIGTSYKERYLGGDAADLIHKGRQKEHDEKVRDDKVGALELLEDGKLSSETEFHRGKGDKEKAESLENIESNAQLEEAKERYWKKYGKIMLPFRSKLERKDMSSHELMMDNIRRYGVKSERPAELEYRLQLQQYEMQHSDSLEVSESDEAGGGTQRWQRQELSAMSKRLVDPKFHAYDQQVIRDEKTGMPILVKHIGEPNFDELQDSLPDDATGMKDGLKEGVSKTEFNMLDKGMTAANKAQSDAKKRLAERICKIFATIAKIAACLTANPWLVALIEVGEGLLEIAVKKHVIGQDYDATEDAKMLAFTAAADLALAGFSQIGKMGKVAKTGAQAEKAVATTAKDAVKNEMTDVLAEQMVAAAKRQARFALVGQGSKLGIQTIGQGVVQDKSPSDILKSIVTGGISAVLPGKLAERVKGAIGNDTLAKQVLGEIAGMSSEWGANTVSSVVGGADLKDAAFESALGVAGSRVQKHYPSNKRKEALHDEAKKVIEAKKKAEATNEAKKVVEAKKKAEATKSEKPVDPLGRASIGEAKTHAPAETHTAPSEPVTPAPADAHVLANAHFAEDHVTHAPVEHKPVEHKPVEHKPVEHKPVEQVAPIDFVLRALDMAPTGQAAPSEYLANLSSAPKSAVNTNAHTAPITAPHTAPPQNNRPDLNPPRMVLPERDLAKMSMQDRIAHLTGIDKGFVHYYEQRELERFYNVQQTAEAANVTHISEPQRQVAHPGNPDAAWNSNYAVRQFEYDNATLTHMGIDINLTAGHGISDADLAVARANSYRGVDNMVNFGPDGHRSILPNGNVLHLEPNFVPHGENVQLQDWTFDPRTGGPARTNMREWMKKDVASPTPLAHGVDWKTAGHEILHFGGLHDEYKDWDFVGREIDSSPLVHRDGSPMGNYHLEHGDTFLKDRHLARFQQDIDRNLDGPAITTGTQPPAPTTSQIPESVLLMLKAYGIPMEGVNP